MASRLKEDERHEKIIRGLLKLPENRRCINCNSLGPQYVCTNFWTFVCTNCSGIHREFTHRVKSVSMAKFTSQEVGSLQGGGNERAREVYFKEWDPQRHSIPDSSNVIKLRDFIKHVYVDRRYTGERGTEKPPRAKMGDKEDSYESKVRGGSRSPPYEDQRYNERSGYGGRNDDKIYRYNYDERRSPGSDRDTRNGEYRKSPVRFEVVDDRRRDDRFGNGRRFEERRSSDGESKSGGISPKQQRDLDIPSPPMVRPVRDILGEDAPPLRVGAPPKANGGKAADGLARTQRTASSSSMASNDGSSVELKKVNSASLIDFNAEPPVATAGPPAQSMTIPVQSDTQSAGPSVDGNWANFDFPSQTPTPAPTLTPAPTPAPSKANTLESLLFELSAPAPVPASEPSNTSVLPTSGAAPPAPPFTNMPILPTSGGSPTVAVSNAPTLPFSRDAAAGQVGGNSSFLPTGNSAATAAPGAMMPTLPISGGTQRPSMQHRHPSLFAPSDGQSSASQFVPSVQISSNQPWNSSLGQNAQGPSTVGQPSQAASQTAQETSGAVTSQPAPSEGKNTGRKELPADLFTLTYSAVPVPVRGWHPGAGPGVGFGMQYPTAAPMPTFPHPSKASNPFDMNSEPPLTHAPSFPSMSLLQGALPPVVAHPGLLRTASLGNPSPRWIHPQSPAYASVQSPSYASVQSPSYASVGSPSYALPVQSPSYASALPPGAYPGQQVPSNMLTSGHQGIGGHGFGGDGSMFGNVSSDQQQQVGRFSQPATPNAFSSLGGNPFG